MCEIEVICDYAVSNIKTEKRTVIINTLSYYIPLNFAVFKTIVFLPSVVNVTSVYFKRS